MSCIKSIQRGTGYGNATITIKAVDINKAVVLISGGSTFALSASWETTSGSVPIAYLSSSTSVAISNAAATKIDSQGKYVNTNLPYAWQVIEFA